MHPFERALTIEEIAKTDFGIDPTGKSSEQIAQELEQELAKPDGLNNTPLIDLQAFNAIQLTRANAAVGQTPTS